MKLSTQKILLLLIFAFIFTGCSHPFDHIPYLSVGMPEEIYLTPQSNNYPNFSYFSRHKVAVFNFTDPLNGKGMGKAAAMAVCQELKRNKIFTTITPEMDVEVLVEDNLVNIARAKNYDIIISGNLLYYDEGSELFPSRVAEQIKVMLITDEKVETLWHAMASDLA